MVVPPLKYIIFPQCCSILYSRKYWWEFNLAVEPKIAIARILVDLNLAVAGKFSSLVVYYITAKLKSAKIFYLHIHV